MAFYGRGTPRAYVPPVSTPRISERVEEKNRMKTGR